MPRQPGGILRGLDTWWFNNFLHPPHGASFKDVCKTSGFGVNVFFLAEILTEGHHKNHTELVLGGVIFGVTHWFPGEAGRGCDSGVLAGGVLMGWPQTFSPSPSGTSTPPGRVWVKGRSPGGGNSTQIRGKTCLWILMWAYITEMLLQGWMLKLAHLCGRQVESSGVLFTPDQRKWWNSKFLHRNTLLPVFWEKELAAGTTQFSAC